MELAEKPNTPLCQVVLGLTLYLDDVLFWARRGAELALDAFLRRVGPDSVRWYTTSALSEWQRVSAASAAALVPHLSHAALPRPRHLFSFDLVDDAAVCTTGFTYREYDPTRGGARASILEMSFPQTGAPDRLFDVVEEISQIGPWWSGSAGFVLRWNVWKKNSALTAAYPYAKRYLGLEIQDSVDMSWRVTEALPTVNWLTLVGKPLAGARSIDLAALATHKWVHGVSVAAIGNGGLLRAGAEPTAGDRNRLEYPSACAEVARELAPYLVEDVPELGGEFLRQKSTAAWSRRFLEPDGWQ
jgi:hypothetical protein